MTTSKMNLKQRIVAPTPRIFRIIRNVGLSLVAVGGTVLAAPTMPAILISVAGYLTVAGTAISAVSQIAVDGD